MLIHTISTTFTQITIYKIKKKVKNNENSIKKKERQKLKDKKILSLLIIKAGSTTSSQPQICLKEKI